MSKPWLDGPITPSSCREVLFGLAGIIGLFPRIGDLLDSLISS
jgi:hypothetical protein